MDDNNSNLYSPSPYPKKKPKKSWVVPMLLGIIIGILLVTVTTLVFVLSDGEISDHDKSADNEPENPNSSQDIDTPKTTTNSINVDVTTQVTDVVEKVSPGVVGVTNIQLQADFWQQQDGNEQGTGSGVIYKIEDEYAYVVTNYHVIEGADTVEVVLVDETHIEAEVLGSDMFSDLAVLRMDSAEVDTIVEMGSSENLKVGEPAIAIGNPLGHMFSGSVTLGVISGTQRTIPVDFDMDGRADWQAEVIQTDAAINPGNSGGALINIDGQLIGINSMKINQTAVEGIGFAIPIDTAQPLIKELEETGEVVRPYLGVEIYSLDEVPQTEWQRSLKLPEEVEGGIYIWSIEPFSPADEAGLKRLDVITALDGEEIMGTIDLRKVLYQEKEIGDELSVTFYRDGKKQETTIKLSVQQ